jgi:hypothetical protein
VVLDTEFGTHASGYSSFLTTVPSKNTLREFHS